MPSGLSHLFLARMTESNMLSRRRIYPIHSETIMSTLQGKSKSSTDDCMTWDRDIYNQDFKRTGAKNKTKRDKSTREGVHVLQHFQSSYV